MTKGRPSNSMFMAASHELLGGRSWDCIAKTGCVTSKVDGVGCR
jgi:hypothetical protein